MVTPKGVLASAGTWMAANKAIVLPAAFAVVLAVNLGLLYALGPEGQYETNQAIDPSGITDESLPAPGVDEDGDSVPDLEERLGCGTSEKLADTDRDGMPDSWECARRVFDSVGGVYHPDPLRADASEDPDHDGLPNFEEYLASLRYPCLLPTLQDSDGDGIHDGYEVRSGLDPCVPNLPGDDTDDDGLSDFEEARLGTNATKVDTDEDSLGDATEAQGILLPNGTRIFPDPTRYSTSGTGISDGWLLKFGLDPRDPGVAYEDPDLDGLTTLEEFNWSDSRLRFRLSTTPLLAFEQGLDPKNPDRDGDGMADGFEVLAELDPLDPADAPLDADSDGLSNLDEAIAKSNPRSPDTDGDGLGDLAEVTGKEALGAVARRILLPEGPKPWKSDPRKADSDHDGLPDLIEWNGFGLVSGRTVELCPPPDGRCTTDPLNPDSDLDGLTDFEEVTFPIPHRLNPMKEDTDADGIKDGAEVDYWVAASADATPDQMTSLSDYRRDKLGRAETPAQLRDLLLPSGDIDGDGLENLVDPDSDGDGIDDGVELVPGRRKAAPKSDDQYPWPATHPGLFDTDGDGLPDQWEKSYARWDYECAGLWNLNPVLKNSYAGCSARPGYSEADLARVDGERDLDLDGVRYTGGSYAAAAIVDDPNSFHNRAEFLAGTDPNERDTDGDGVDDGWEEYFRVRGHALDPLKAGDVNATSKSFAYRRYVTWSSTEAQPNPAIGEVVDTTVCQLPCVGREGLNVLAFTGSFKLTYLDEFGLRTNPSVADSDGDRMSDAWEAYWRAEARARRLATVLDPVAPTDADLDFDIDGLTNVEEFLNGASYRHPTSPLDPDTDNGGLSDGQETQGEIQSDPLDPADDNPEGDPDGDGLKNSEELSPTSPWAATGCAARRSCLKISDFDSDKDGLLDGPDSPPLSFSSSSDRALIDAMLARGIVVRDRNPFTIRFYGELGGDKTVRTDPSNWDSDADSMPDGYEIYYRRDATQSVCSVDADGDGLDDCTEYALGRPATWDEAADGPWWFGSEPYNLTGSCPRDTDCDGITDGRIDVLTGKTFGGLDYDYDNDGLNDFTGEDPFPFYDPLNVGTRDPKSPAFIRQWLETGRRDPPRSDSDSVPDASDNVFVELRDVVVTFPTQDGVLLKGSGAGAGAVVTGKVVRKGTGPGQTVPVPGVLVLANYNDVATAGTVSLAPESRVVGVAISQTDGTFRLEAIAAKERSVLLGNVTLTSGAKLTQATAFGKVIDLDKPLTWNLDTSLLKPGLGYSFVLWTYGVAAHENRYSFPMRCVDHPTAGCFGDFQANGVVGTYTAPWKSPTPGAAWVKTATKLEFDTDRLVVANNGTLATAGTLLDAAGDPVVDRPVVLTWRGVSQTATTVAGGKFSASFDVGRFDGPARLDLTATVRASENDVHRATAANQTILVSFPTTLTGTVATQGLFLFAGGALDVDAVLRDAQGRPIPQANVTARLPELGLSAWNLTDSLGRTRLRITVPETATVGTQSVSVHFAGNESYQPANRVLQELVSIRQRATIRPATPNATLGKVYVVEGVLEDSAGRAARDPAATSPLVVTIETPGFAGRSEVSATGAFSFTIPPEAFSDVGRRTLRFSFPGSPFLAESSLAAVMNVTSTTTIELVAKRFVRGAPAVVEGQLLDAVGRGVPRATVNASVGGSHAVGLTNSTGHFAIPVPLAADASIGPTTARASFAGTDFHRAAAPASKSASIVSGTRVVLAPKVLATGPLRLEAKLVDDSGNPVGGAALRFQVGGSDGVSGTAVTDTRGEAQTTLDGSKLAALTYRLRAVYEGGLIHGPATGITDLTILSRTHLTLANVTVVVRGSDLVLEGSLREETGVPVARAPLVVTLNQTRLGTIHTGPRGEFAAPVAVPADFERRLHALRVSYAGSANHVPTEVVRTVEVASATSIEVLLPGSLRVGEAFTGRILLRDDTGAPVPEAVVRVRFSGYFHPFTLKTNDTGIASFPGRITSAGSSSLDVQFPGEEDLLSAQKSSTIDVAGQGLLPGGPRAVAVAIVAALAVLAVGSLFLARFRRRQLAKARGILSDAELGLLAGNEYVATILHAYKRLTEHFVRFGYVERADVTPQEFAAAARAALPVREEPLRTLIRLFEEARYSDHTIGAPERTAAIAALAALNRDLASLGKSGVKTRRAATDVSGGGGAP